MEHRKPKAVSRKLDPEKQTACVLGSPKNLYATTTFYELVFPSQRPPYTRNRDGCGWSGFLGGSYHKHTVTFLSTAGCD